MATRKATEAKAVEQTTKNVEATQADALQKLKEEILAETKAEAAKIIEEAKAEAAKVTSGKEGVPHIESEEELAALNELVEIKLFKDKDKYNAPVLVILNGKSWLIKRGVSVKVPRKVAEVLANSDAQTGMAADVIKQFEEQFDKNKEQLT